MNHMLSELKYLDPARELDPDEATTCSYCKCTVHVDDSVNGADGMPLCCDCSMECNWCGENFNVDQIFKTVQGKVICRECYALSMEDEETICLEESQYT